MLRKHGSERRSSWLPLQPVICAEQTRSMQGVNAAHGSTASAASRTLVQPNPILAGMPASERERLSPCNTRKLSPDKAPCRTFFLVGCSECHSTAAMPSLSLWLLLLLRLWLLGAPCRCRLGTACPTAGGPHQRDRLQPLLLPSCQAGRVPAPAAAAVGQADAAEGV